MKENKIILIYVRKYFYLKQTHNFKATAGAF